MTKAQAFALVNEELDRATKKFGEFVSIHEGLGIIREEYREFEDAVFWATRREQMNEATQLAAMALRFLIDCVGEFPTERTATGGVVELDDRSDMAPGDASGYSGDDNVAPGTS